MAIQTINIAPSQYLHIYCENQVKIINLKSKTGLFYTLNYSTKFNNSWINVENLKEADLIGFKYNNIFIYNNSANNITIDYEDNDADSIPPLVLNPPPDPTLPAMNTMLLETNLNNFCSYAPTYEYTIEDFSVLSQNCVDASINCFHTFRVVTDSGSTLKIKDAGGNILEPAINNPQNQYIENLLTLSEISIDFNDKYAVGSLTIEQDGVSVIDDVGGNYKIIKDYSVFLFHDIDANGDQAAPILFFSTEGLNFGVIKNITICVFEHGLNNLKLLEAPIKCEGDLLSIECELTDLDTNSSFTVVGDIATKTFPINFDNEIENGTYYCVKATATLENGHSNTIGMLAVLDDNFGKIINIVVEGDFNYSQAKLMRDNNSLYNRIDYTNGIEFKNIQDMQKMSLDLNGGLTNNLTIKENNKRKYVFNSEEEHIYKDFDEIQIQNKAYPIVFFLINNDKLEQDTLLLEHGTNTINFEIPILNNSEGREISSINVETKHIAPYTFGQVIETLSGDIAGKYVNITISNILETGTLICIECTVTLDNGISNTTRMVGKII